jgi:hypothetical protein
MNPIATFQRSEIQGMIGFFLAFAVLIALGDTNRRKQLLLRSTAS